MLKIENLSFSFGELEIFSNLNFEVLEGEIFKIFGPSGKGKTTLLKIIGGLLSFEKGNIFFDKKEIKTFSKKNLDLFRSKNIGFVFQDGNLIESFTGKENIDLVFAIQKTKVDKEWQDFLFEELEIKDFLNKKISNLSGGQKERINICRALIGKPKILLGDEIGSSLDLRLKNKIYDLVYSYIKKDKIAILITHDEDLKKYKGENFYLN